MAYRDSTTGSGNSDTPSVAVPSGVASGDIVILTATIDNTAAVFDTGDWPTGFTELQEASMDSVDGHQAAIGWKRLTGSDSGSYTFGALGASGDWVCQAYAFSGRHASDPPVATQNIDTTSSGTPVSAAGTAVTAVDQDDIVWICAPDVNASGAYNGGTVPSSPSYTEREDAELAWSSLFGGTIDAASAGSTGGTGSFALSSGSGCQTVWVVRIPVSAGGTFRTGLLTALGAGRGSYTA